MPKRTEKQDWESALSAAIKDQHRFGYSVRNMRGKVQLQRYWSDTGKRQVITLPIDWSKGCQRDVLNAISSINESLTKGLTLREAADLTFDSTPAGPTPKTNWLKVLEHFRQHKVDNGLCKSSTFEREYVPRLKWLIEVLTGPDAPNSGQRAIEAMRWGANGIGKPGSGGRKRRIQACAAFLNHGVNHCGLDERWKAPPDHELKILIGQKNPNSAKTKNEGQAAALSDEQFLRLFDSIKDSRWRLVVGLMGTFGLRGVELNHLKVMKDGLWVGYEKRNGQGTTEARLVPFLDPDGRPGLGKQLLLTLESQIVRLPSLGNEDRLASMSINQALLRNEVWRELKEAAKATEKRVSCYSLRHCFADRCAMAIPAIPAKAAAAAMGHSLKTHLQIYQKHYDGKQVLSSFEAANNSRTGRK